MELRTKTVKLMGSTIEIMIYCSQDQQYILDETVELLKMYEDRFSANKDSSELMEINNKAGISKVVVNDELFELIKIGKEHSLAENSLLNIALGPIIQSWRIGFDDVKVPSKLEIDKLLEITDPRKIILDEEEKSVYLMDKGMLINLGALAKGYIADRVVEFLKGRNISSGLVNLGGNVLTFGNAYHNKDNYWRIGIQNPNLERGNHVFNLLVKDESVVTSGIYERKYNKDGETYHHILSPKTGYPVTTDVASLTIVSKLSVDGEIWTTRLFGKNSREIIAELDKLENIYGIVITTKGQIFYSKQLFDRIIL